MSELNEMVEVIVEDAGVITVPIDDTLSNAGEAADAKAVGDALALKADASSVTAIQVNGQSPDAQGKIIVTAADTKMSSSDSTTIKAKIEAVDGKTATDIPVSDAPGAQTIAQALSSGANRTADEIGMSPTDPTTVKSAVDTVKSDLSDLSTTVAGLNEKNGANIRYNATGDETIKQHVDALAADIVKSVNDVGPDANGNVALESVPYADNLKSSDMEQVDGSFLNRMTGGTLSISGDSAWILRLLGNILHTGYTPEVLNLTVSAAPRPVPPDITAVLDEDTFEAYVETAGTYTLRYTDSWSHDPADYGVTVSNDPVYGDQITIVWDGVADPVMTVSPAQRYAPPAITATINRLELITYVSTSTTITLTYTTGWDSDPALYGITVTNDPVYGDQITVVYVQETRGTITPAEPETLKATGWNLYNHTSGKARVLKYSNTYGFKVGGAYTSIAFGTTPDAASPTPITPDANGNFNITADGYIFVTGGNSSSTFITPTWTDWTETANGGVFEGYTESVVNLFNLETNLGELFPYGLCKVGDVRDEIDFDAKNAIRRIDRQSYSEEARAAAAASGYAYDFDESYLYTERATPVVTSISLNDSYVCNDHGIEFFSGTVQVDTEILYGVNLKDKLRKDVVTVRAQVWNAGEKAQARENIGAASVQLDDDLAIVVNGNKTTYASGAAIGDYVLLRNSTITGCDDGAYIAAKAIPANTAIDSTYLTAVSGGVANALNGKIPIAPDWSDATECCTAHNVEYVPTKNGYIKVSQSYDRGMQLNINGVTIYYVSPSYWGTSSAHMEWLVPVKKGDTVKLLADSGTLPSGMKAVFYPARTA